MLPVVAIVGRPNVGKSTLFNVLTKTRDALVADMPGVTRDRQYGLVSQAEQPFVLVDTGGLVSDAEGIDYLTAKQVHQAIEESDLVIFVASAKEGLSADDEEIARLLRRHGKPVSLVVNKIDGGNPDLTVPEFSALGFEQPLQISAAHRQGMDQLLEAIQERLPETIIQEDDEDDSRIRLAIIGRPNVGKSTLVNRLLGEERVLAYDMPGTTRDTIKVIMERDGVSYELLDTAGVRRRAKVTDTVEKFSVIKALQAISRAHVVVLMLDASEGLTDQDTTLLGHVLQQGRALVIAVNKWDGLSEHHRQLVKQEMDRRLVFVPWARRVTLSALHGSGLQELMSAVKKAYKSATMTFSTSELTRVLQEAFQAHQPPMHHGRTAKLRYAHSGGQLPPRIIIHGNRLNTLPDSYKRYLENQFIRHFKLSGTPVALNFRSSDKNPFKDRKKPASRESSRKNTGSKHSGKKKVSSKKAPKQSGGKNPRSRKHK